MTTVPLQTLEELELSSEEFEALVMAGLTAAMIEVMNTEDIERALRNADQTALDAIVTIWAAYVAAELSPALELNMLSASASTIAHLAEAVGNPLTLLVDQALDTELYLQQARNRLVAIGDALWFNARSALAEGTELGESIPKLAARIMDAVGVTEGRARMIARTESHGARNTVAMGTMQRFESAYGIPSGVMRKEWQCVTGDAVVAALDVAAVARRYYKGPMVTIRTASGAAVSLTPEHRVLTGRGWIEAQALNQGDQLFRVDSTDAPGTPDVEQRPMCIGDVVDALIDSPTIQVRTVPGSVNLDSQGTRGDVDVVWADSSLSFDFETSVSKESRELFLTHADSLAESVSFSSRGSLNSCAGFNEATAGITTLGCASTSIGFTFPSRAQLTGCAVSSNVDVLLSENPSDDILGTPEFQCDCACRPAICVSRNNLFHGDVSASTCSNRQALSCACLLDTAGSLEKSASTLGGGEQFSSRSQTPSNGLGATAQGSGDFLRGIPAPVSVDDIMDIQVHRFSGHVYDLSTASEWFSANELVIHNSTTDTRTRETHREADGQTVAFSELFTVGGFPLAFPGDPTGPPQECINCRCATFAVFDPNDLNLDDNGAVLTLNAAAYEEEQPMPWRVETGNAECGAGQYAVVKEADGEVEGCHDTEEAARAQLAALYASETQRTPMARNVAPWSGVIVVEGAPAYDGQEYAPGALTWPELGATESLEIPLGWKYERAHGGVDNGNTVDVGRVDHIERIGNEIHARGVLDLDSPWGREAARQMGTRMDPGFLAGISIIDDSGNQGDVEVVMPEGCEELPEDAEGSEITRCMTAEKVIYHSGRIRSADLVSIPAFVEARVYLDDETAVPDTTEDDLDAEELVTASAYTITIPDLPPAEWFDEPKEVPEIGAITVTDEGRFFGYLAPKQVAHRGYRDKRVTVPTGNVDYGIWMNRATMVDDGNGGYAKIATGPITMDCGHAPMGPKGSARREHYDNACSVVATARVGENARGVWISGALIPGVNAEQVARMMACQLSGDWGPHREKPGKRELAAALLVPVPGFPTRSRSFTIQGGELARTVTPVRFGSHAGVTEPVGMKAAVNKMAAQVGRDPESRMREFALSLRKTLRGDE